jgi:DNA-binding Lrp family transcriptional regulator
MTGHTNGLMPDSAEAHLVALLDATVDELQQRHDLLKAELAEVATKLTRYKKMQHAGEAPTPKPAKSDKPPVHSSPRMRERVLAALRDAGEPRSVRAIAETVGASRGIVDAAIKQLREDDLVRFAGKDASVTSGMAPATWATFPDPDAPPAAAASLADGPIRPAKDATREKVLAAVREHGQPATFADIKERSGLSDVTTRNAVRALEQDGLLLEGVAETRADGKAAGKMPHTYTLA